MAEAPLQAMVPNAPAPAPTLPMPTLLVYPSLRAAWVLYEKDKNSTKLFETITKSQKVAKYTEEKTIIFATEAGKLHILK